MKKLWFLPYNPKSEGLQNLAMEFNSNAFEVKFIFNDPTRSKFVGSPGKKVINWGNSTLPDHVAKSTILNHPDILRNITHKLRFFQNFHQSARLPAFTRTRAEAAKWFEEGQGGMPFAMARTVLQGHSGEGIVELITPDDLNKVPEGTLITQYIRKKSEWRLHFSIKDGLFFTQKKVRRNEVPDPNWRIRSFENGFNFANGDEYVKELPKDVHDQAQKLFTATGLHFGAVDVIYNTKREEAYVLEVNSAPGLTGTTVNKYYTALENMLK